MKLKSLAVVLGAFSLAACSGAQVKTEQKTKEKVEQEVKATPPSPAPLLQLKPDAAFDSSNLSAGQKRRLKELYADHNSEQDRIKKELSKNKTVLMKSLVNSASTEEEIELLKNHILELERERTSLFMSTLDQAETILGRKDLKDERVYRAFLMNPEEPEVLP